MTENSNKKKNSLPSGYINSDSSQLDNYIVTYSNVPEFQIITTSVIRQKNILNIIQVFIQISSQTGDKILIIQLESFTIYK